MITANKFFLTSLVFVSGTILKAQDTINTKFSGQIVGKVIEVGVANVRYKGANNLQGPDFVLRKKEILNIHFQNGTRLDFTSSPKREVVNSLPIENAKVQLVKFNLISLPLGDLDFGYEKVLKPGFNVEGNLGIIGAGLSVNAPKANGYFLKGGIKFLLSKSLFKEGTHYGHPLNGQYVKVEFAYTSFDTKDVSFYKQDTSTAVFNYSGPVMSKTNVHTEAYSINIIYGHQYIIKNRFSLEFFGGLGIGNESQRFSDAKANVANVFSSANDHAFIPSRSNGVSAPGEVYNQSANELIFSITGGLTIGYLF